MCERLDKIKAGFQGRKKNKTKKSHWNAIYALFKGKGAIIIRKKREKK